jgi:hypothetical protein
MREWRAGMITVPAADARLAAEILAGLAAELRRAGRKDLAARAVVLEGLVMRLTPGR